MKGATANLHQLMAKLVNVAGNHHTKEAVDMEEEDTVNNLSRSKL